MLAQPNYPHLCRLPAEALAADWSLHLQLVAWEGETTNTESPDNRAECLLPTTCSNWDFEGQKDGELWKELEAGLKHPKKNCHQAQHLRWSLSGMMLLDGLINTVGT